MEAIGATAPIAYTPKEAILPEGNSLFPPWGNRPFFPPYGGEIAYSPKVNRPLGGSPIASPAEPEEAIGAIAPIASTPLVLRPFSLWEIASTATPWRPLGGSPIAYLSSIKVYLDY